LFLTYCIPVLCSPGGPGIPFGTWYIALFDILRVLCVIGSFVLISSIVTAWHRSYPRGGQRDRYLALGLFAFIIIGTEISNIGNIASWRLALSIVAVVFALRGLKRFDHEQPATP
jgi:hypothetical protein